MTHHRQIHEVSSDQAVFILVQCMLRKHTTAFNTGPCPGGTLVNISGLFRLTLMLIPPLGRCIRLTDVGNLPIDARWMSTNEFEAGWSTAILIRVALFWRLVPMLLASFFIGQSMSYTSLPNKQIVVHTHYRCICSIGNLTVGCMNWKQLSARGKHLV